MSAPLFTVFTPTYDRAHTLERVYKSLLSQTFSDFEWLIVDDGSKDGTNDLVRGFLADGKLKIRYIQQPNGGKHVAFNCGVREARGELFLPLDSDDSCIPTALERFRAHWLAMSDTQRLDFSGITCLCKNEKGDFVGGDLPFPVIDGHPYQITSRYRLTGEKWGFHRTDVLRSYPFPEFEGERFVPESLVWNRIGRCYEIRFINEALRHYFNSMDGLSSSSVKIRLLNPRATFLYYSEVLMLPIKFRDRFRAAANLWRFALQNKQWNKVFVIRGNMILVLAGFVPGVALALLDQLRLK
ncbi:MAG: glycosyltransferase family A protein [Nitrososphaerales archaeon]